MRKIIAVLGLCVISLVALADVPDVWYPEDGTWRNPAAPGRNFKIDVQDDVLILNVFGYKANGAAVWYQAANGWIEHQATQTKVFNATLNEYKDGQCVGCPYTKPVLVGPNGGSITITFTGQSKAFVNWEGDKFNIERSSVVVGKPPRNWLGTWIAIFKITSSSFSDFMKFTEELGPTKTPGSVGVVVGMGEYDDPVALECFEGAEAGALEDQCIVTVLDGDTSELEDIYMITSFGVNNAEGRWHSDNPDYYDYPAWFKRMAGATDTIENIQPEGTTVERVSLDNVRRAAIDAELAQTNRSQQATVDPIHTMAVTNLRDLLLRNIW